MISFVFLICTSNFSSHEKKPGENTLLHARERAEENDPPKCGQISEMLKPRKSKDYLQKYLQKRNKANLGISEKKHFFKVFIFALEKCYSGKEYFSDFFGI